MFERWISREAIERGRPSDEDLIAAGLALKALRGEKNAPEDLACLERMWRVLIQRIQDYAVNRYSARKTTQQREAYLKRILERGVLYEKNEEFNLLEFDFSMQEFGQTVFHPKDIGRSIYRIMFAIEYALQEYEGDPLQLSPEFDPFSGGLEYASTYFDGFDSRPRDWLVEDVLVRNRSAVIGGPIKALKTYILLDLMISLGSGTPFLNRFIVPKPVRVMVIAGEDSDWTLNHRVWSICKARGIDPRHLDMITGAQDKLPNIGSPEALNRLCDIITADEVDVIAIDPFYLALALEDGAANANSIFAMGRALTGFANAIHAAGATPIITHHFTKQSGRERARAPELSDLSHAGIGAFARQWILVNRRGRHDPNSAVHKLRLSLGGYTHGVTHDVEFAMEPQPDGLWGWEPRFAAQQSGVADPPTQEKASTRKPSSETNDQTAVLKAIQEHAGPAVAKDIRASTKLSYQRVKQALARLLEDGRIRKVPVTRSWRNRTTTFDGYEPTAPPSSLPPTG